MGYGYSEDKRVLDKSTPLVTREDLLIICSELDEETPEEHTDMFIKAAHTMIVERLDGFGIATDFLAIIEQYLAAHFAVLTNPATSREAVGPLSVSYFGKIGLGLSQTRYGQTALSMDPTGRLEPKNKQNVVLKSIGGV